MFDSMQQYIAVLAWCKDNCDLAPQLRGIWTHGAAFASALQ
ncbi:hypothetical protein TKWG_18400 [Advenella kashmirensis WT001]|uniref:Uncharacterized protein n=1 Tax=Advenella kashmirensis (strain DSM 17095 / LMG 22695 / WT001) TaxID=1036672 RepID=I3UEV6_ADVKW|nr:hypothetical protein TKWG_18400 [Advenella kashmirensis WT001]